MNLEAEGAQDTLRRIELTYSTFLEAGDLMDSPTERLSFYRSAISIMEHPDRPYVASPIVMRELRHMRDKWALLIQGAIPAA